MICFLIQKLCDFLWKRCYHNILSPAFTVSWNINLALSVSSSVCHSICAFPDIINFTTNISIFKKSSIVLHIYISLQGINEALQPSPLLLREINYAHIVGCTNSLNMAIKFFCPIWFRFTHDKYFKYDV